MPKKPEPESNRSPAEASAMMDATLKKMLASPPVTHDRLSGQGRNRARKKRTRNNARDD
jgi:hypothetical protein